MELSRLRDFIVLAEELHYERAAIRIGSDQSGLSRRIRELEREIGVKLFTRTTRGTQIAPAGSAFLPFARSILGKMEQGQRVAREAACGTRSVLRVGVCDEVPVNKLARVLAEYRSQEPRVDVQLLDRTCAELIQDLEIGVVDIGLSLGETTSPTLRAASVWKDGCSIMLPAAHPLTQEQRVTLEAIVADRVIVGHRQCTCGARIEIDHFIRSANEHVRIDGAANLNMLRAMVSAGHGVGLVSGAQAEAIQHSDITLRPLVGRSFHFETFVLQRRESDSRLASRFFELARQQ